MRALVAIIVAVVLVGFGGVLIYPRFKRIEKRAAVDLASVQARVPKSLEAVADAISNAFNRGEDLGRGTKNKLSADDPFHRFYLYRAAEPSFPDEFQIKANTQRDRYLAGYAAIPRNLRKSDFYLAEPTGDFYWFSEYYYNGRPAKFRCSFIIHLEPQDDFHTKIEVFEYLPTIWVGEKFGWSAHTGPVPGFFYDIRSAEATTLDRVELLKRIQEAMAKPRSPEAKEGNGALLLSSGKSNGLSWCSLLRPGQGSGVPASQYLDAVYRDQGNSKSVVFSCGGVCRS